LISERNKNRNFFFLYSLKVMSNVETKASHACSDPECQSITLTSEASDDTQSPKKEKKQEEPTDPTKQLCPRCKKEHDVTEFQGDKKAYKNCQMCRDRHRASYQKRLEKIPPEVRAEQAALEKERKLKYKEAVKKLFELHPEIKAQVELPEKEKKEAQPTFVKCECGTEVRRTGLKAHCQTKKHRLAMGEEVEPDPIKECECGAKVNARGWKRHISGRAHIAFIEKQQSSKPSNVDAEASSNQSENDSDIPTSEQSNDD
jgi:hypothetical protein